MWCHRYPEQKNVPSPSPTKLLKNWLKSKTLLFIGIFIFYDVDNNTIL